MKKLSVLFLVCIVYTSSIHSLKPNSTQPSTKKLTKKKRGWGRRRLKKCEIIENEEVCENVIVDVSDDEINSVQELETKIVHLDKMPTQNQLTEKDLNLCMMLSKIEFTKEGMSYFFNNSFNRREYSQELLPHSFSHFIQFLDYAEAMNQPQEFYDGILRLFNQKLKACPYVSAHAIERLLERSTPHLSQVFPPEPLSLWKEVKKTLWQGFRNQFTFLTSNPMGFFEDISDQIIAKVKIHSTTPDRLRSMLVRFLGTSLDKTIWSPDDQEQTWESFKKIGMKISELHDKNVIVDEYDLNDLYWSLLERYCHFLDLTGSKLSLATCDRIKNDLVQKNIPWLELEEQEEEIESKMERLSHAIIETEAKIRIRKEGILTDIMPLRS